MNKSCKTAGTKKIVSNETSFGEYLGPEVNGVGLLPSLNLTFLPLKMDGFNTTFLLGRPIFRGYVSFREGMFLGVHPYQTSLDGIWMYRHCVVFSMFFFVERRWKP